MNFKQKLMACTALLGAWLFHPATAGAQSAEAQKIERLERQTELLQRQLKEIQEELARTRKRTEKVEAKVEAAPAHYSAPPPMVTKGPLPPPPPDRVKVTLGGFVAAETVWRQHNMGSALAPCLFHLRQHWLGRLGISHLAHRFDISKFFLRLSRQPTQGPSAIFLRE